MAFDRVEPDNVSVFVFTRCKRAVCKQMYTKSLITSALWRFALFPKEGC